LARARQGRPALQPRITGRLDFDFTTLDQPLDLTGCRIEQPLSLRNTSLKALYLQGSHTSRIDADNLRVAGNIFLRNGFTAKGEVWLSGAEIGGNVECDGGSFENPDGDALLADQARVTGGVFLISGFTAKGAVKLIGAEIGGYLTCSSGQFEKLSGSAFSIGRASVQDTFFRQPSVAPQGQVDLSHARIGQLYDDPERWPPDGNLMLDGLTFDALSSGAPVDATTRLRVLRRQPKKGVFYPQPYEQLVKVLRNMGHEGDARKIAITKQDDLRRSGLLSRRGKLQNWLLSFFIGHGYRIWPVVLAMPLFILFGFGVFEYANQSAAMKPAKERILLHPAYVVWAKKGIDSPIPPAALPPDYPKLQPLIYSLEVFLPIVDLHQESFWLPRWTNRCGWWFVGYLWFHIIVGWALTTVAVVGITGIMKKD
jgi:hypothetical protein